MTRGPASGPRAALWPPPRQPPRPLQVPEQAPGGPLKDPASELGAAPVHIRGQLRDVPPRAQPVHHLRGVHSRLLIDWASSSREGRDVMLRLVTTTLAASSCQAQFPTQETISFGFWYILQDDIIACEPEQYQQCVALFGPIYTALVNAMLHKSMYDPNDGEWSTDQRESLRCYRTDIADTIMYSFNILRDGLLHSLLQQLDHALAACLTAPRPGRPSRPASTPGTPWPSPSPTARRRGPTPALHVAGQAPRHPLPQQHTGDLHRAGLHRRVLRLAGHAPQLLPTSLRSSPRPSPSPSSPWPPPWLSRTSRGTARTR